MAGNKLLLSRPRSMENTLLAGMMMYRYDHETVLMRRMMMNNDDNIDQNYDRV